MSRAHAEITGLSRRIDLDAADSPKSEQIDDLRACLYRLHHMCTQPDSSASGDGIRIPPCLGALRGSNRCPRSGAVFGRAFGESRKRDWGSE